MLSENRKKSLSENIKYEVRRRGISLKDLAEQANVSYSILSKITAKSTNIDPHLSDIIKIADALDLSIDSLINRTGQNKTQFYFTRETANKAIYDILNVLEINEIVSQS